MMHGHINIKFILIWHTSQTRLVQTALPEQLRRQKPDYHPRFAGSSDNRQANLHWFCPSQLQFTDTLQVTPLHMTVISMRNPGESSTVEAALRASYRGADKSLARPTSRCILLDGENISFDASLVIQGVPGGM